MFRTATPDTFGSPARVLIATALVALVVACNPPAPTASPATPSPSPSPSSSPSPSASASPVACTAADLGATGGPWGGAAGSRGADVVVTNNGAAACLLPAHATVAIVDASGAALVSTPPQAGSGPTLEPGGTVGFSLLFGNFCSEAVSLPVHVSLALASGSIDVQGLNLDTTDALPPCNGPGQPASLSTTDWAPS